MSAAAAVKETQAGVSFAVRVAPRASRTGITGVMGEGDGTVVKIALAAPPVDGRANEEMIAFLAKLFDLPRSGVEVIAGQQSKNKVIRVRGRSAAEIQAALATGK